MTISGFQRDLARQAANVAGALFQVGMTAVAASSIQAETDQATPLIEPALYAFVVWGPIFGLSLAYAGYQALPANRTDPLLRRIGWFTAAAFAATGFWSVLVPQGWLLAALGMLALNFVCLGATYLRIAASSRRRAPSRGERWLIALPVGIFLGWMTAANVVSLLSELVRGELLAAGGTGEAAVGAVSLLLGGALAALIVRAGATGPTQAALAYGGTVLWALVGVVAQQYDASTLTTGAAVVAALPVLLALLDRVRRTLPRRGGTAPSGAAA